MLVTTAVEPRYRFYFFPPNLKQEVGRLLKLEVKSKIVVRLVKVVTFLMSINFNKPKTQLFTNGVPNDFCRSTARLKQK